MSEKSDIYGEENAEDWENSARVALQRAPIRRLKKGGWRQSGGVLIAWEMVCIIGLAIAFHVFLFGVLVGMTLVGDAINLESRSQKSEFRSLRISDHHSALRKAYTYPNHNTRP